MFTKLGWLFIALLLAVFGFGLTRQLYGGERVQDCRWRQCQYMDYYHGKLIGCGEWTAGSLQEFIAVIQNTETGAVEHECE